MQIFHVHCIFYLKVAPCFKLRLKLKTTIAVSITFSFPENIPLLCMNWSTTGLKTGTASRRKCFLTKKKPTQISDQSQPQQITLTDCANNGSFLSVRFVLVGCRQDIGVHTCSIPYRLLYEAVFELKEAGFKLDVTKWVPRLTQSVSGFVHIKETMLQVISLEWSGTECKGLG